VQPYNEQASNFSATVLVSVIPSTNVTEFKYEINYSQINQRNLTSLQFTFSPQIANDIFFKAYGESEDGVAWNGTYGYTGNSSVISYGPKGGTVNNKIINGQMFLQENSAHLKPGQKLTLWLLTQGNQTIPGIVNLEGYCNIAVWLYDSSEDYNDDSIDTSFRPKIFKVVGPVLKPVDNTGLIDKLIELTTGSYDLQWISKMDVFQGLIDKLKAAKQQIIMGWAKYHTACNILEAYKNQLNAQRGKSITESCYQMLYYNSDLLISKLK
jgi:hypothetical protein